MRRLLVAAARFARDMLRSKASLAAENEALRQQLGMLLLRRDGKRVRPDPTERGLLAGLTRLFDWRGRSAVPVFKPETLVGWHRKGFKLYWCSKSGVLPRGAQRRIPERVRRLIRELQCRELGQPIHRRSVGRILEEDDEPAPTPRGQSWATWLQNHLDVTWATDLFTVPTWGFRELYVLVVLHLGSRRLLHLNVTEHPTDAWIAQQFRNVIMVEEQAPKNLIRDRDKKFGAQLETLLKAEGVDVKVTPYRAPKANAYCERVIRTLRDELTSHTVPRDAAHLWRLLLDYKDYYNHSRAHQGLNQRVPAGGRSIPRRKRRLVVDQPSTSLLPRVLEGHGHGIPSLLTVSLKGHA